MAKDASDFEQIPDVQEAHHVYELAQERLYGGLGPQRRAGPPPPPNPEYLQVMATALQVRQLCRLNVLLETLIQRESKPHE
jgi:hypothetical protein